MVNNHRVRWRVRWPQPVVPSHGEAARVSGRVRASIRPLVATLPPRPSRGEAPLGQRHSPPVSVDVPCTAPQQRPNAADSQIRSRCSSSDLLSIRGPTSRDLGPQAPSTRCWSSPYSQRLRQADCNRTAARCGAGAQRGTPFASRKRKRNGGGFCSGSVPLSTRSEAVWGKQPNCPSSLTLHAYHLHPRAMSAAPRSASAVTRPNEVIGHGGSGGGGVGPPVSEGECDGTDGCSRPGGGSKPGDGGGCSSCRPTHSVPTMAVASASVQRLLRRLRLYSASG